MGQRKAGEDAFIKPPVITGPDRTKLWRTEEIYLRQFGAGGGIRKQIKLPKGIVIHRPFTVGAAGLAEVVQTCHGLSSIAVPAFATGKRFSPSAGHFFYPRRRRRVGVGGGGERGRETGGRLMTTS